jgi:hypothetical protein
MREMAFSTTNYVTRGTTVFFTTTFFDVDGNIVQPDNATINIAYTNTAGAQVAASIAMTPPTAPAVTFTAQWDSRGVNPGNVSWSIHTGADDPPPVTVEDGTFTLTANPANLPTF